MLFKKKCPVCGARNDKERMTCIECGFIFGTAEVEEQVAHVPTEGERELTKEVEKTLRERVEGEHIGDEQALYRVKGRRKIHRKGSFWTVVVLLIPGTVSWGLAASSMAERETEVAIVFFITAAIFTGIGVRCVKRGMRPKVSKEKISRLMY